MSISKKRDLLLTQLFENFMLLEKSMIALAYSYEKCDDIGEKEEYDLQEQRRTADQGNVERCQSIGRWESGESAQRAQQ